MLPQGNAVFTDFDQEATKFVDIEGNFFKPVLLVKIKYAGNL